MSIDLSKIRNIGIAAHIDAGKTTTTERILFYTGATHAPGEVDQATTKTDFDPQEQERGITIFSAAVSCPWNAYTINLIDTPGHVDFTAEVERCLRVLDGAVTVFDAKEGVEPQSETVWRQADKYHVPRICFINKMDKVGADFQAAFESLEKRLGAHPVAVQIPIGSENSFEGIIDLVAMKALYFDEESKGNIIRRADIPEALVDEAAYWRHQLEEQAADLCDALMEKLLEEQPISANELRAAIRGGTVAGKIQPVLCGSSLKFIGVQPVIDAVCDYLPSPLETGPAAGLVPQKSGDPKDIEVESNPNGPLVAYVFKIVAEKPVDLYFVRIYSGRLKSSTRVLNASNGQKENLTRIFRMFAKRRDQLNVAEAGEIVAVIGPKTALTGHTLCDPGQPIIMEQITFPDTVISQSVEPISSKDRDKLLAALESLARQDPTFQTKIDEESRQILVSGMGELHLEVLIRRLKDEVNMDVRVSTPRASYRETITSRAQVTYDFSRQLGGKNHSATVTVEVDRLPLGEVPGDVLFENKMTAESIEPAFVQAIEEGVMDAAASGPRAGYPMVGWKAALIDARQHETESSDLAFESAARMAFAAAAQKAGPALLEPIMSFEIRTPEEFFGVVNGDLNARRAVIKGTGVEGEFRIISAEVPLSTTFGYVTRLRSMSQGRASVAMTPSHYAIVPNEIAAQLVGEP